MAGIGWREVAAWVSLSQMREKVSLPPFWVGIQGPWWPRAVAPELAPPPRLGIPKAQRASVCGKGWRPGETPGCPQPSLGKQRPGQGPGERMASWRLGTGDAKVPWVWGPRGSGYPRAVHRWARKGEVRVGAAQLVAAIVVA